MAQFPPRFYEKKTPFGSVGEPSVPDKGFFPTLEIRQQKDKLVQLQTLVNEYVQEAQKLPEKAIGEKLAVARAAAETLEARIHWAEIRLGEQAARNEQEFGRYRSYWQSLYPFYADYTKSLSDLARAGIKVQRAEAGVPFINGYDYRDDPEKLLPPMVNFVRAAERMANAVDKYNRASPPLPPLAKTAEEDRPPPPPLPIPLQGRELDEALNGPVVPYGGSYEDPPSYSEQKPNLVSLLRFSPLLSQPAERVEKQDLERLISESYFESEKYPENADIGWGQSFRNEIATAKQNVHYLANYEIVELFRSAEQELAELGLSTYQLFARQVSTKPDEVVPYQRIWHIPHLTRTIAVRKKYRLAEFRFALTRYIGALEILRRGKYQNYRNAFNFYIPRDEMADLIALAQEAQAALEGTKNPSEFARRLMDSTVKRMEPRAAAVKNLLATYGPRDGKSYKDTIAEQLKAVEKEEAEKGIPNEFGAPYTKAPLYQIGNVWLVDIWTRKLAWENLAQFADKAALQEADAELSAVVKDEPAMCKEVENGMRSEFDKYYFWTMYPIPQQPTLPPPTLLKPGDF